MCGIRSWSHNPSSEVREVLVENRECIVERLGIHFIEELDMLASMTKAPRPRARPCNLWRLGEEGPSIGEIH
ncbi:MAG: hypothetical protein QW638_00915 [Candidatus Bathyarchaeia archaeon]|nr:hypothetical protein [Candidatus Bathyarchaeota archaeon]